MLLRLLVLAATLVGHCRVYAATPAESSRMISDDWKKPYKAFEMPQADEEYMKMKKSTTSERDDNPGTRQECRTLSDATRRRTFDCIRRLFTTPSPSGQDLMYSMFEKWHRRVMSPGAHGGSCFLPWHRQFLARLEQVCRDVCEDPSFSLCYWDLTLDSGMPTPCQSAIFSEYFYGNPSGQVVSGFAANKPCLDDCGGPFLSRDCGAGGWTLSSAGAADAFINRPNFRSLATPFLTTYAENFHGLNHMYVGGHMSFITCSPCDPLFFAYHCWLDYLWSRQQDRQRPTSDPGQGYPTDPGVPQSHRIDDPMSPFDATCGDGIRYPSPFTPYAPSPRTCRTHGDCGGRALWCNRGRCMGCVGPGGTMQPGWPNATCYIQACRNPVNRRGICACGD